LTHSSGLLSRDFISAPRGAGRSNVCIPYNPQIAFSVGLVAPGGLKLGSETYF